MLKLVDIIVFIYTMHIHLSVMSIYLSKASVQKEVLLIVISYML